jgi:hypothetical protein
MLVRSAPVLAAALALGLLGCASSSGPVSVPSVDRVVVTRTGGIAGRTSTVELTADQLVKVQEAVASDAFSAAAADTSDDDAACCDRYSYTIEADVEGRHIVVVTGDGHERPQVVSDVIDVAFSS